MKTNHVRIWIEWNTKNTSNLEESAEMLELSEEEEISSSVEWKRPRGSQTRLTLISRVYDCNILKMQLMGIILPGVYTTSNLLWPTINRKYNCGFCSIDTSNLPKLWVKNQADSKMPSLIAIKNECPRKTSCLEILLNRWLHKLTVAIFYWSYHRLCSIEGHSAPSIIFEATKIIPTIFDSFSSGW